MATVDSAGGGWREQLRLALAELIKAGQWPGRGEAVPVRDLSSTSVDADRHVAAE